MKIIKLSVLFQLSLFAALLLCLSSCSEKEDFLILNGNITNSTESQIKLSSAGVEYNTQIENGQFTFKILVQDDVSLYSLSVGEMVVPVYLIPNEELTISFDMKGESNAVQFEGKTKAESNYFWNLVQIVDYEAMNDRVMSDSLFLFLERHNAYYDAKERKLTLHENADPQFYELAKASNKFQRGEEMLYYAMTNRGVNGVGVSDDYYAFIETLDYDNAKWLQLPRFGFFLSAFSYNLMQMNDQSDDVFQTILETFKDKSIVENLYFRQLEQMIGYKGADEFKKELKLFDSLSNNQIYHAAIEKTINKWDKLKEGTIAPEISAFNRLNERVNVSQFKGKVVYIDLWATWCAPCIKELPHLTKIKEYYKDNEDFKVIGISLDKDKETWKTFLEKKDLKGTQLIAKNGFESKFVEDYLVNGIPRFILIDANGNLVKAAAPNPSEYEELTALIDELLTASSF